MSKETRFWRGSGSLGATRRTAARSRRSVLRRLPGEAQGVDNAFPRGTPAAHEAGDPCPLEAQEIELGVLQNGFVFTERISAEEVGTRNALGRHERSFETISSPGGRVIDLPGEPRFDSAIMSKPADHRLTGRIKLAPARKGEETIYGARRPGYPERVVEATFVSEWISFMQQNGFRRVCCLLPLAQLAYYRHDLLGRYREKFGESNVCHAPIEDYHLCDPALLEDVILPFLHQSDQAKIPVVVHCSGGSGRTGHVLAAWLVRYRGLSVDDALATIVSTGRNPREAVECGNATEQDLRRLLAGPGSQYLR